LANLLAQRGRGQQPAADPAVVKRGLDIFTSNCAACHGIDAVTIREADGARHTVNRRDAVKVEIKDPLQAHADRMKVLTDRQMHDLTAYLAGVK
jgi:mono/diheme cytochrome c family protein